MSLLENIKDPKWLEIFEEYFKSKKSEKLKNFLENIDSYKNVAPKKENIFKAFELTNFNDIKVVILGQDPYYSPNCATGLAFGVNPGNIIPPSLRNIFKEISISYGFEIIPGMSSLEGWADQGVLLMNSVMTVEEGYPGSHACFEWEKFTDFILKKINKEKQGVVFLLWGSYAHKKENILKSFRNLTLKAPHPSPLSAYRGFLGCNHFVLANSFLEKAKKTEINWYKTEKFELDPISRLGLIRHNSILNNL